MFLIGLNSSAQNKYTAIIKSRADLYATATKKYDFKNVVQLTCPKYVSLINKDTLLSHVSNNMVALKKEGLRYNTITFEQPKQVYESGDEMYCILPQKIVKSNSQGTINIKSYLFAISDDYGKSWFFLNHKQFQENKEKLFPLLNKEFIIPEISSKFIRNKKFSSFDKPN